MFCTPRSQYLIKRPFDAGRSPFAETLAQLDLLRDTEVLSGQGTGKVAQSLSEQRPISVYFVPFFTFFLFA